MKLWIIECDDLWEFKWRVVSNTQVTPRFVLFFVEKITWIRPSKINRPKVFLIQTFLKFGEGGPYYLLFFTNLYTIHFCVKFKFQRLCWWLTKSQNDRCAYYIDPWTVCHFIEGLGGGGGVGGLDFWLEAPVPWICPLSLVIRGWSVSFGKMWELMCWYWLLTACGFGLIKIGQKQSRLSEFWEPALYILTGKCEIYSFDTQHQIC